MLSWGPLGVTEGDSGAVRGSLVALQADQECYWRTAAKSSRSIGDMGGKKKGIETKEKTGQLGFSVKKSNET